MPNGRSQQAMILLGLLTASVVLLLAAYARFQRDKLIAS